MKHQETIARVKSLLQQTDTDLAADFDDFCRDNNAILEEYIKVLFFPKQKDQAKITAAQTVSLALGEANVATIRSLGIGLLLQRRYPEAIELLEPIRHTGDWQARFALGQSLAEVYRESPGHEERWQDGIEDMVTSLKTFSMANSNMRDMETWAKRTQLLATYSLDAAANVFEYALDHSRWSSLEGSPEIINLVDESEAEVSEVAKITSGNSAA